MNRMILAGLIVLLLVVRMECYADSQQSQVEMASMPYSALRKAYEAFGDKQLAPHVRLQAQVGRRTGTTNPPPVVLTIASKTGLVKVPMDPAGAFQLPLTDELLAENPMVLTDQPKGTVDLFAVAIFRKDATPGEETIPYSEVMLPYTFGRQLEQRARQPNDKSNSDNVVGVKFAFVNDEHPLLKVHSTNGITVLKPDNDGVITVPFSEKWLRENPAVVFPKAAIRWLGFAFQTQPNGNSEQKGGGYSPSAARPSQPTP